MVNSSALWLFLNGPYRRVMARNVEIGNAIFVPRLDIARRAIVHFDGRQTGGVSVLAHEATHSHVARRWAC